MNTKRRYQKKVTFDLLPVTFLYRNEDLNPFERKLRLEQDWKAFMATIKREIDQENDLDTQLNKLNTQGTTL